MCELEAWVSQLLIVWARLRGYTGYLVRSVRSVLCCFFCPTAHMFSSTFFFTRSHALSHLYGFLVSVGVGGPIGIRYQSAMQNIGIGTMHILIVLSHTMYFLGCCPPPPPPRLLLSSGARRAGGLGAFLSVLSAAQSAQIVFFLRLHARSNRFF